MTRRRAKQRKSRPRPQAARPTDSACGKALPLATTLVRVGGFLLDANDSERFRASAEAGRLLTPPWWPLGPTDLSDAWALYQAGTRPEEVPDDTPKPTPSTGAVTGGGRRMSDSWVHLDVAQVLKRTDAALLLRLTDGEEHWIPLSQISDEEDYDEGDVNCTVSVSRWIADKRGLS